MPQLPITLIKGDKVSSKTDYRDALPVNMYAVKRDILGAKGYLLCYPGLAAFVTGEGIDRGANYNERFVNQYRVSGESLISVKSNSTFVLGDIPGNSQVSMPYSFNTQAVIAEGRMFLYPSSGGGLAEITDGDLGNPIDGVWVDGYYFLTDGEYIYHTDITDESSIDPIKFATAEFMPDPSLGVAKTQDNKVLVFGRYTLEYFVNDASEQFSFRRVETRAQKIGIVATHAKCETGENFYITGGRKDEAVGVHVIGIGRSEKISTREIDKILSEYTEPELSDIRMESRMEDDVTFVLVHLPDHTLCFNETIAKSLGKEFAWTLLKSDTLGNNPYRGINGVFDARLAKWVYGDRFNDSIGTLDGSICTQYDVKVEWILYTPFVYLDGACIDEIEIETIPGHSTVNDATVAFSLTQDGVTYGKEYWNLYGEPSKYGNRFYLRRIGYVGDWVGFKFRGVSKSRMSFGLTRITYA